MTLKDVRDKLSRKIAENKLLGDREINHALIEDINGDIYIDYLLKDEESDVVEDDEDDYDSELEDDEDDSELSWEDDDDSELY